jgi:hemolysin activation/secretion protein
MLIKYLIALGMMPLFSLWSYAQVHAQTPSNSNIQLPKGTRDRVEQTIPNPNPQTVPLPKSSPSDPIIFPPQPSQPPTPTGTKNKITIKTIQVLGNTVLKPEINQLISPYIGQSKTFDELLELRSKITQLYLENGYLSSGAFIPNNQDLTTGNISIQVIEGELEKIEITGLKRLQDGYIRKRLELGASTPLNKEKLERSLQLLQIDPLLSQVNAELGAGSVPGRNILRLILKEAPAFHANLVINNDQSPSVGSFQTNLGISHDNLLGFGDQLSLDYGRTAGLNLYGAAYALPLNPNNGTLNFRYSTNNSKIIQDPFQDLGIRSESQTLSMGIRQPLIRSVLSEFALGLNFDLRRSQTFILDDIPFSFSEGSKDGESKVTAIRFIQDWVDRSSNRVLAARSQFSLGINAFGATSNAGNLPDGQFFSWLGQFQWVQPVAPRIILVSRLATQLTPDSLLSLERFSLGGADTVRGYRQNQVVSDNGILGSFEFQIPITRNAELLRLHPFLDWGYGWNQQGENPDPNFVASVGMGLRSRFLSGLETRLDYAIPLIRSSKLEDQRLHFSLRYQLF